MICQDDDMGRCFECRTPVIYGQSLFCSSGCAEIWISRVMLDADQNVSGEEDA